MSLFAQHMAMVDQYTQAIDLLDADEETAAKLGTSTWNNEKRYFLMNLSLDDGGTLPLHIVAVDDFDSFIPDEGEGVICSADELPDMNEIADQLHYCLTAKGLFHWSEGQWIAITHSEEAAQEIQETDDLEVNDQTLSDAAPDETQGESDAVEAPAAPPEPIIPVKQASPATEPIEGLWLDDLTEESEAEPEVTIDEFANLSSVEIAGRLLSAAANGNIPSDESMATLIHQLLEEGVQSHDARNCHDQLVEAIVLAKILASNNTFPMCRNIYFQLHAAIPFFRETGANTGVALSGIFADETEYTDVTKLCAYIYGMLFPAHAHDHTFAALYNNAFTDYESQFPGLDVLKPLYHKAMEGLRLVPTAFSPANLAAMSDSKIRQERMNSIRTQAKELLKPPAVKVMIHGVPELIDLYLDGTHYKKRLSERDIPPDILEALLDFDASTWTLQTAEVRTDRGKFVNSTWEKVINGHHYWVTIGIGNYVKTIVDRTTSGMDKCIRSGELFDYVESVNAQLMADEGGEPDAK